MAIWDGFLDGLANRIADRMGGNPESITRRKYYIGDQKRQLAVKTGKTDDNIIVNLVGLAVDRSVSHVLAGGVEFDLPELDNQEETQTDSEGNTVEVDNPQQDYIDAMWEVNRKSVLLLNLVINASVFGTGYIKIIPEGVIDPYTALSYPRLIALNPEYLTIETDPQDQEKVISYKVEYKIRDYEYREITRLAGPNDKTIDEDGKERPIDSKLWMIFNQKQNINSGQWENIDPPQVFPYDFPNILHVKNLPSLNSVYGSSDIDDILGMQDKSNFTISSIQKQVRLQSHKQPWGKGIGKEDKLDVGPDTLVQLRGENAELGILDFQTDIAGSLEYAKDLRQSIFDIAREVDITSITDKLGALTNFGLRVLYTDALGKCDTKRLLLGEMLLELNRRLLVLNGMEGEASRPGEVIWNDPLPVNVIEKFQGQAEELAMGVVDKQTIAEENGRDWEAIKARLDEEKSTGDNAVGAAILRAFNPIGGNIPPNQTGV
jgi:hypothetical protein